MHTTDNTPPRVMDPTESGTFHRLECDVQRHLLASDELDFSSLTVRRTTDGVCLEGRVERAGDVDIVALALQVPGCEEVLNHLLVRDVAELSPHTAEVPPAADELPRKG